MGAINKTTNKYEYPKIADKKNKYMCPSCEKDVIFRNGKILKPHFAHFKSYSPCYYYDKPSETQLHKDAKLLLKSLLDNKRKFLFYRKCYNCLFEENTIFEHTILENDYNENTIAVIENKFYYNNSNRSADVALIENGEIKYIFEICYKNKTKEENRPEPWFEIKAEPFINQINSGENIDEEGNIIIECIRNYKCDECIEYENFEKRIFEKMIIKEKEQLLEKDELIKMSNEDERSIQIIENKRKEQEKVRQYFISNEKERKEFNSQRISIISQQKIQKKEIIPSQYKKETICWIEKLKEKEENRKKTEILNQECNCGLMLKNICNCKNPKYELTKSNNNLCCINCNKWKCRCK